MKKNGRPNGVFKQSNPYADALSSDFFERTPKSVFAALAVSYIVNHQGVEFDVEALEDSLLQEWATLHKCEFIPQRPIKPKVPRVSRNHISNDGAESTLHEQQPEKE